MARLLPKYWVSKMSPKIKIYYYVYTQALKAGKVPGMMDLPENLKLFNGSLCDAAIGPCSCGAWHQIGEDRWELQ